MTPIFNVLTDVFDSKIDKPYEDYSKVINIDLSRTDTFISVDIFKLRTKTQVGQFLVVFNPVLKITNLLFTELLVRKSNGRANNEIYDIVKSNTTQYYYSINPYDPNVNMVDLQYKEDDLEVYKKNNVMLDAFGKNLESNPVLGFEQGMFVDLKIENEKDQDL